MNRLLLAMALPLIALQLPAGEHDLKSTPQESKPDAGRQRGHMINDPDQIEKVRRSIRTAVATGNGISYHGGPLMTSTVTVYYIWYGNWNGNTAVPILENFARNFGGSGYYNTNSSYTDGNGTTVRNSLLFGGSTNDTYSQGSNLSDSQIWQVVSKAITGGKVPSDPNGVYFVLTSADVTATSGFCTQYCGWHWFGTLNGTNIKYSFVGDSSRCPNACAKQPSVSPNSNVGADGMASVVAHELSETVTDPNGTGWYDAQGQENGDKCAWSFGTTFAASNGSSANITLGNYNYLIQQMWLNAGGGSCVTAYSIPLLSSMTPSSGVAGSTVAVSLSGSNFSTGANLSISGTGVTASNVTVVSPTQITANLNIAGGATPATHDVAVTMGAAASSPVAFTVNAPGFTLASVAPAAGTAGTVVPVTLTGTNFTSGATLKVQGSDIQVSNVAVVSPTKITANLTISPVSVGGARAITVSSNGVSSAPQTFTVTSSSIGLTSISPSAGTPATTVPVTLTGSNFSSGATVQVSGSGVTVSNVVVVNAAQITANFNVASNSAAGARNVTVTSNGATSPAASYTVSNLSLSSVSPASGQAASIVPITLTGVSFASSATIQVSGTGITVSNLAWVSATQLSAKLYITPTAALGVRTLTVSQGSLATNTLNFTVTAPAVSITGVTPASGAAGSVIPITLTGTGFDSSATVQVSGTGVTVTNLNVASATQITAKLNIANDATQGARALSVVARAGISTPAAFTVNAHVVTLTSAAPASGNAGTTVAVLLTGAGFGSAATVQVSGTGVTVSGVTAVSATQIRANLAIGKTAPLGVRTLTVTSGSATSSTVPFTITLAALASISPAAAAAGTTANVTLTGANFTPGMSVTVSSSTVQVNNVSVVSPTRITAQFVIGANTATAPLNVQVINGSSSVYGTVVFTAVQRPSVSSITPAYGYSGATVTATLTGNGFASNSTLIAGDTGITIGRITVASATSITAQITFGGSNGNHSLTVVTPYPGGINISSLPFNVYVNPPPPSLTSMSPSTAAAGQTVAVTLTGTNFTSSTPVNISGANVSIGTITARTPTTITAYITVGSKAPAGTRMVSVRNPSTAGASASGAAFTITAANATH